MLLAPFEERTLGQALDVGSMLVAAARLEGVPCFAASLIRGPAVVIGQHQRAPRVLDVGRCRASGIPVFRRSTAGTAAFAGRRALVFSLALPHVAALFPDASPRTLLNRNVRPFLRGLTAAGALAHYFGREWVSVRKRPAMLLGFDAAEDGAVLVEAIAGFDEPFALPDELASDDERAADRFTGHVPVGLAEVLPPGTTPETVAGCVADMVAARAPTPVTSRADCACSCAEAGDVARFAVDLDSMEPVPAGAVLLAPARVPIGWLERAIVQVGARPEGASPGGAPLQGGSDAAQGGLLESAPGSAPHKIWIGGDVMAPRFVLDRLAAVASGQTGDLGEGPLEGVSADELVEKARA